jgi:Adenosine-deaminase (editase) domain
MHILIRKAGVLMDGGGEGVGFLLAFETSGAEKSLGAAGECLSDEEPLVVVSLGTGTKCLGGPQRSASGDLVNDSHAEARPRVSPNLAVLIVSLAEASKAQSVALRNLSVLIPSPANASPCVFCCMALMDDSHAKAGIASRSEMALLSHCEADAKSCVFLS